MPTGARHLLPVAAVVFLATWATHAFYQALVPALTVEQLGTSNALALGLVSSAPPRGRDMRMAVSDGCGRAVRVILVPIMCQSLGSR